MHLIFLKTCISLGNSRMNKWDTAELTSLTIEEYLRRLMAFEHCAKATGVLNTY